MYNQNNIAPGVITSLSFQNTNLKIPNDTYEVFVNGNYVGNKILFENEESGINSVKYYLEAQGFSDFTYKIKGKYIYIESNDKISQDMIDYLKVYLRIR